MDQLVSIRVNDKNPIRLVTGMVKRDGKRRAAWKFTVFPKDRAAFQEKVVEAEALRLAKQEE